MPRLPWAILGVVSLAALTSTAVIALESALPTGQGAFALIFGIAALTMVFRCHSGAARHIRELAMRAAAIGSRPWLMACVMGGILLRLTCVSLSHLEPQSDAATYVALATRIAQGLSYETAWGYAYWPPGYPFLLSIPFALFGPSTLVPPLLNIALFTGTILVVHRLAQVVAGRVAARLSTLILTLWPNYFISSLIASKEQLLAILLPLALLLHLAPGADSTSRRISSGLATGALLGYASLTQPSCLLLFGAFGLADFTYRRGLARSALRLGMLAIGMALVLAPWTLRNYRVFHTFVLISTNGGYNFYRANNPMATGSYIEGEGALQRLPEIERGRAGMRAGVEWIKENPIDFVRLAIRKQVLFLGDDGTGLYEVWKRGRQPGHWYEILRGIGNSYWIVVWTLILVAVCHHWRSRLATDYMIGTLILTCLYFLAVHSIFESADKYHDPLVGILAVLASLAGANGCDERASARTAGA